MTGSQSSYTCCASIHYQLNMAVYRILPFNRIFLEIWLCLIISVVGTKVTAEQVSSDKPLIVTTKIDKPFVISDSDPSDQQLQGNDRFKGFSIDLLNKLATSANFTFAIRLVKDGRYGWTDATGTGWTGMIGELVNREADLAIGSITITDNRKSVVDFTEPFLGVGLTILTKKSLNPEQPVPFHDFEGLANQTDIQYGVVANGSTMAFLQNSTVEPYKSMWTYLSAHPENFAKQYPEGVDRVRNSSGKYAFIVEKSFADYVTTRSPCDIISVGEALPSNARGYGIALQKNSPLTQRLSSLIAQWKSDGTLVHLLAKWWNTENNCKA